MMDISAVPHSSILGRVLRAPLRLIPKDARLPIIQGPLRGKRWIVGASTHGCWLGTYEHEKRLALQKLIGAGDVVYDVGANVGYYTLLCATLVGAGGRVIAFEPLPRNLAFLREHLDMNGVTNVRVVDAAVSATEGEAHFEIAASPSMGRISAGGSLRVRCTSLDSFASSTNEPPPTVIRMDIEGAEKEAMRGAQALLRSPARPLFIVALHGADARAAVHETLRVAGYRIGALDGRPVEISDEIVGYPPDWKGEVV